MSSTDNRFDFLRLIFAAAVFLYHLVVLAQFDLEGHWEPIWALFAELSIQGFFIISGALVLGSLERSKGVLDYAGKRVRRLYPAYVVVILIPVLISLYISWGQAGSLQQIGQYLGANLIFLNFLQPELPGLFQMQRFEAVNGALWTLKIEVMFYMALPVLLFVLKAMGRLKWLGLAALYVGGAVWAIALPMFWDSPYAAIAARQLPGQMAFFATGMALWWWVKSPRFNPWIAGIVGCSLLALSFAHALAEPIRALGLGGIVAAIAYLPGPQIRAARWGDISYGVYIIHFPIIQSAVSFGFYEKFGVGLGGLLTVLTVFGLSYALWWGIERRALRASSQYLR